MTNPQPLIFTYLPFPPNVVCFILLEVSYCMLVSQRQFSTLMDNKDLILHFVIAGKLLWYIKNNNFNPHHTILCFNKPYVLILTYQSNVILFPLVLFLLALLIFLPSPFPFGGHDCALWQSCNNLICLLPSLGICLC